jgi:hypothetical protein
MEEGLEVEEGLGPTVKKEECQDLGWAASIELKAWYSPYTLGIQQMVAFGFVGLEVI